MAQRRDLEENGDADRRTGRRWDTCIRSDEKVTPGGSDKLLKDKINSQEQEAEAGQPHQADHEPPLDQHDADRVAGIGLGGGSDAKLLELVSVAKPTSR